MKAEARIKSILQTNNIGYSVTGLRSFKLSDLILKENLAFELPDNLRLGHLAEKVVSESIKASTNYHVLYENFQIIQDGKTIGEIDFIIEESNTRELIHIELAYKFYLYDPSISSKAMHNWIGPNRNDSLREKLEKLKRKQFPLLQLECTKSKLLDLDLDKVSQALCLLVSLYLPYEYRGEISSDYSEAVKGYYVNIKTFRKLHQEEQSYYLPPKKEWGISPAKNNVWSDLDEVEDQIKLCLKEKKAPLIWQKYKESYIEFFIVWW